jgi:hypothetical protein
MKVIRWILIMLLLLGAAPSRMAAQDAKAASGGLTNQDVVDLVKTGLSTDIIVAKIKASPSHFDTSTAALKSLKDAGVPDAVIVAMVDPSSKSVGASQPDAMGSGPGHVHVYRQRLLPGNNFNPPIYLDNVEMFKIGNDRRCSFHVTPGPHTITSDDKSSVIQIDAKPGQEFFISVQELPGGFLKGRGKLTLVQNEQGRPEYKVEKPLEDEKKLAKDMIDDDSDAAAPAGNPPAAK